MLGLFERKEKLRFDPTAPLASVRFTVIDTELTGLDERKDSIVSFGAVRMTGSGIRLGETFYRIVSPGTALRPESVVIHEITPTEAATHPAAPEVLQEFLRFCGDDVLVGHFLAIDRAFLNREMKLAGRGALKNPVVDTFSIYEWLRKRMQVHTCLEPDESRTRLYDIVKCFGIPVNGAHNALMDAYITAQLFQRLLPLLERAGAHTLGDILSIGIPFEGGDRFGLTGEFGNF